MKIQLEREFEDLEKQKVAGDALWLLSTAVGEIAQEHGDYNVPHLGSTLTYDRERGLYTGVNYPDILQRRVERYGCALNAETGEILLAEGIIPSEVFEAMRNVHKTIAGMDVLTGVGASPFESYGIHFTEIDP